MAVCLHACPCEPKVCDLDVAARVDEDVGRLQVAVKHIGGVDVLESPQELVQDELQCEATGPDPVQ